MSNEERKIKKHYPTTLGGLISALYDKATGNDTSFWCWIWYYYN